MSCGGADVTVGTLEAIDDILPRWIDAEARGDTSALDALLDPGFRGDDPRGRVLTKDGWIGRHRTGDLVVQAFEWRDTQIRSHGNATVVTGTQHQQASYRGEDWSGRFRATLVAVRRDGAWSIVNLQLGERMDDV